MPSLLDLTSQGDVGTITDESKLASVTLMTPQQLYELWERQNWQSHTIDLSQDVRDWQRMDAELRSRLAWNLSSFFVGEERVTIQFEGQVVPHGFQGANPDSPRRGGGFQPDLQGRAPPRRLRHLVPAREGCRPRLAPAHRRAPRRAVTARQRSPRAAGCRSERLLDPRLLDAGDEHVRLQRAQPPAEGDRRGPRGRAGGGGALGAAAARLEGPAW